MTCSVISFTFCPTTSIEYILDVQNSIEYYLINIGKYPHVILKISNNSLDKYYICYGFLNCLILKPEISTKICVVSATHTNACLVLLFLS